LCLCIKGNISFSLHGTQEKQHSCAVLNSCFGKVAPKEINVLGGPSKSPSGRAGEQVGRLAGLASVLMPCLEPGFRGGASSCRIPKAQEIGHWWKPLASGGLIRLHVAVGFSPGMCHGPLGVHLEMLSLRNKAEKAGGLCGRVPWPGISSWRRPFQAE
jgi:hypothetical protein